MQQVEQTKVNTKDLVETALLVALSLYSDEIYKYKTSNSGIWRISSSGKYNVVYFSNSFWT